MQNTALMGAMIQVLGLDPSAIRELIRERFKKKGEEVITINLDAFDKAMAFAKEKFAPGGVRIGAGDGRSRPLAGGNPMLGFGMLAAGCRFYSAYPMTPASSLLHWLVKYAAKTGVLVKQCEDEIAAINMAIGAGHVGVRAATGTSGGGFALMTEAVGEAGMTETPVVIVEVQRGACRRRRSRATCSRSSAPPRANSPAPSSRPARCRNATRPPSKPSTSPRSTSARS
jgi:2-oxoglutarate ferredoxin oxidoreductase subunit alpha